MAPKGPPTCITIVLASNFILTKLLSKRSKCSVAREPVIGDLLGAPASECNAAKLCLPVGRAPSAPCLANLVVRMRLFEWLQLHAVRVFTHLSLCARLVYQSFDTSSMHMWRPRGLLTQLSSFGKRRLRPSLLASFYVYSER